jgi:hypothetical protein
VVRLHAAGALRRCTAILTDMAACFLEDRDELIRVAARAHLETWIIGMYSHLDGNAALDVLIADYKAELQSWQLEVDEFNVKLAKDLADAEAFNRVVRKQNADNMRWNEGHPEATRPIRRERPTPVLPPMPVDHANELDKLTSVAAAKLGYWQVAK